jgi:hypothetical protein
MLADIATGNTGTADVFFLIAVIVFGLAALLTVVPAGNPPKPYAGYASFLVALGLAFTALAFLLL